MSNINTNYEVTTLGLNLTFAFMNGNIILLFILAGLCQAKVVASDLWRKHSRSYNIHQARFPNPNNRDRRKRRTRSAPDIIPGTVGTPDKVMKTLGKDGTHFFNAPSQIGESREHGDAAFTILSTSSDNESNTSSPRCSEVLPRTTSQEHPTSRQEERITRTSDGNDELQPSQSPTHTSLDNDSCNHGIIKNSDEIQALRAKIISKGLNESPTHSTSPVPTQSVTGDTPQTELTDVDRNSEATQRELENHQLDTGKSILDFLHSAVCMSVNRPDPEPSASQAPCPSPLVSSPTKITSSPAVAMKLTDCIANKDIDMNWACDDASNIFPKLSDKRFTLLETINILVQRHKNNYFLNWTKDQLNNIEPIVRPRNVVTRTLYRRYCRLNHRNHDASLRFVIESTEPWANDFHTKLITSENDGGFRDVKEVRDQALNIWNQQFISCLTRTNIQPSHGRRLMSSQQTSKSNLDETTLSSSISIEGDQRMVDSEPPSNSHVYNHDSHINDRRLSEVGIDNDSVGKQQCVDSISTDDIITRSESSLGRNSENSDPIVGHAGLDLSNAGLGLAPDPFVQQNDINNDAQQREKLLIAIKSASDLFHILPESMAISDQVVVWLERHKNGYFLQVPLTSLMHHPPHVRPMVPVTEALYKKCMDLILVSALQQLTLVITSTCSPALAFKNLLANHKYHALEYVLVDAMKLWNNYVSSEYTDLTVGTQSKNNQGDSDLYASPNFIAQTPCNFTANNSENKPIVNGDKAPFCSMSPGTEDDRFPYDPLMPVDTGCCDCTCDCLSGVSQHPPTDPCPMPGGLDDGSGCSDTMNDEPLDLRQDVVDLSLASSKNTSQNSLDYKQWLDSIWRLRPSIRTRMTEGLEQGLDPKLQEYKDLLHQKLGSSYEMPTSQTDRLLDLILCHIYQEMSNV